VTMLDPNWRDQRMSMAANVVNTRRVGNYARPGRARRVVSAAQHAIILEPGPVEEGADAPIWASRLGGMPDLPAGIPWPRRSDFPDSVWDDLGENLRDLFRHDVAHSARPWPLSLVAQIDFAEIHSAAVAVGLP